MAWRSVIITTPAYLKFKQNAMKAEQADGEISIPLEDIAVILLDHPQITLTHQLLSECMSRKIAVITVGQNHLPNGLLLPYLSHSRVVKSIRAQLAMRLPQKNRLWQQLVKQKVTNQAEVLCHFKQHETSCRLQALAEKIKSGDKENLESLASQLYFPALFDSGFNRQQQRFHNAALNYAYALVRSALARQLVAYGFMTALGLHHHNEKNPFNLADDLIEPFRPIIDAYVLMQFPIEEAEQLLSSHKSCLLGILHEDIPMMDIDGVLSRSSVLAATEWLVVSLQQRINDGGYQLHLPLFCAAET